MTGFALLNVRDQRAALRKMAGMVERAIPQPVIVRAARAITRAVDARDDRGELEAIFEAVKSGTPYVPGLEHGVRYVADPRATDFYTAPARLLEMCRSGSCASDCDEQAMLVAALAGAIGFPVGLRAYAPQKGADFEHVYPVAMYPKEDSAPSTLVGMDTTVPESTLGWEPPKGHVETAWIY